MAKMTRRGQVDDGGMHDGEVCPGRPHWLRNQSSAMWPLATTINFALDGFEDPQLTSGPSGMQAGRQAVERL